MPISSLSSWKDIFIHNKNWEYSNKLLDKIRNTISPTINFENSFEEISKNPGVTFLSLDPAKTHLQLFHHPKIIGGSWTSPETKLVAVLGFDADAKPIQIVQKSVKDFKFKSFSAEEFAEAIEDTEALMNLKNPKQELTYKNIIALPHLLTKVFMSLESKDPISVATAFLQAMYDYDSSIDSQNQKEHPIISNENNSSSEHQEDESSDPQQNIDNLNGSNPNTDKNPFMTDFIHAIQFCHLCHKGKISPVFYTLSSSSNIKNWFYDLQNLNKLGTKTNQKRSKNTIQSPEKDEDLSSPESKISRKDKHFLNAMLKIHETLDKNMIRSALDRDEKEPGFARLEHHKKIMILNASAIPPFDDPAPSPTEFYSSFLKKKS